MHKVKDHRKEELIDSHTVGVYAYDKCMSGWGEAEGGWSIAIWYCKPMDANKVEEWVENRGEMIWVGQEMDSVVIDKAILVCQNQGQYSKKVAHVSLYSVGEGHPALG